MGKLKRSATAALNGYSRKGGKQNRRKQVAMAIRFAEYLENVERLKTWEHLSQRQVVRFYKAHRHLTERTIGNYYYSIRQLCEALGAGLEVPRPKYDLHLHTGD